MTGRSVLIVGSSGIGLATAVRLAVSMPIADAERVRGRWPGPSQHS